MIRTLAILSLLSSVCASSFKSALSALNPAQRQAVLAPLDTCVKVLAGPGSGKTRVLTHRIQYMLEPPTDDGADAIQQQHAENILAITFTNKAAKEMRTRLSSLIGYDRSNRCFIGTFHAFSAKCLRIYGRDIFLRTQVNHRLDESFTIFDQGDCLKLVKELLKRANIDDTKVKPNSILSMINTMRGNMALSGNTMSLEEMGAGGMMEQVASTLLQDYVISIHSQNAMDFEGLLINMYKMLQDPEIRDKIAKKYRHCLVDEMQDTNGVQYEIIKALCGDLNTAVRANQRDDNYHNKAIKGKQRSLFLVGDKNQAIYGWRGAKVDNVDNIHDDFNDVLSFSLKENYRCSPAISRVANALLGTTATVAMEKKAGKKGEQVRIIHTDDDETQAKCVASIISTLHQDPSTVEKRKRKAKHFAVLYRTNAQSRALEAEFVLKGIPYVLVGGRRFFDRKEVKDLLTILKFIINDKDDTALIRILSEVVKGVGDKTVEAFLEWQLDDEYIGSMVKLNAIIDDSINTKTEGTKAGKRRELIGVSDIPLTTRQKALLLPFAQVMVTAYNRVRRNSEDDNVAHVLDTLSSFFLTPQYYTRISKNSDDAEERKSNVMELLLAADKFDAKRGKIQGAQAMIQSMYVMYEIPNLTSQIGTFLEECVLSSGSEDVDGAEEVADKEVKDIVFLSTIHASKGLEFNACFIVGLEEGCLPITRSPEDKQRKYKNLKSGGIDSSNIDVEREEDMTNRRNFEAVFGVIDDDGNDVSHSSDSKDGKDSKGDVGTPVTSGQGRGASIEGLLLNDSPAVQEERRLAFVAVTRAKEMLFLLHRKRSQIFTAKGSKWIDNQPSRFLEPLKELEKETVTSLKWK